VLPDLNRGRVGCQSGSGRVSIGVGSGRSYIEQSCLYTWVQYRAAQGDTWGPGAIKAPTVSSRRLITLSLFNIKNCHDAKFGIKPIKIRFNIV